MVALDEFEHERRETAELGQQLAPGARVAADDVELLVGQRAGLVEDRVRDRELAHVVQQAAEREQAQAVGRQVEPLADPHGQRRHAARVTLGRAVLLGQAQHQRVHAAAEEGLLVGDEVLGVQVADQRQRRGRVAQVERRRDADEPDAGDLEARARPTR